MLRYDTDNFIDLIRRDALWPWRRRSP